MKKKIIIIIIMWKIIIMRTGNYSAIALTPDCHPIMTGYLLFYLQFPDASLAGIVVGGDHGVLQEIEYVVSAFYQPFAEPFKFFFQVKEVGLQQFIQLVGPRLLFNHPVWAYVSFMYGFAQQFRHIL